MGNESKGDKQLSPLKRAFLKLEEMQVKLETAEGAKKEPIAIIGIGCRFPGGAINPDAFWRILRDGVDCISEIPKDRWDIDAYYDPNPDVPGKILSRRGGFLDEIDHFDPQFFGIAPREAVSMDPQQRLLLETSWEALENAGQAPDKLSCSRTGVFIGMCKSDYMMLQLKQNDPTLYDVYYASGNAHSIMSGRLSYILGLQGPSITIDTACSSSLVALHLACQSLRQGECEMTLVGGVNVILSPENTISFSQASMLSAEGRCKTFDAGADGFVQGEGCGVVVLKRLSDAVADGNRILALIRGTAVNQDGASSGLTAPNGPSQVNLLREALANANVHPSRVGYVEAHGTATSLGDPIEIQALGEVYSEGRTEGQHLMIGSAKTNFGHLEAAAGIASLIKAVLCLQHREIPPHLHLREPNPFVRWEELSITVPRKKVTWTPREGSRIAGVSSFGFSGTNAHVIVEEASGVDFEEADVERPLHILSLSAKSEKALRELCERFEDYIKAHPTASLADVCFTVNTGRAHLSHRLAMWVDSMPQLGETLAKIRSDSLPSAGLIEGQIDSSDRPRIAFLFTGQGSQYPGMGRKLYESQPTFRKALDRCDKILGDYLDRSLLSVLYPEGDASAKKPLLDQTAYTQPALFSIEYALAELWRSWGIEPSALMGHSVGEYVAACVAGIFSLEDGLKLIAERGRLMQALPRGGRMAAVFTNEERIAEVIKGFERTVSISAVNGPENVVISGKGADLETIFRRLEEDKTTYTPLYVSHAFHSPLMEPILIEFEKEASKVRYSPPRIRLISNISGKATAGDEMANAAYWRRHIRKPVLFSASIRTLYAQGYRVFVEIGPHPVLLGMGAQCLPDDDGVYVPSLRRGQDDWEQVLESAADLYVHGAGLDWEGFDRDYPRCRLPLPTYPFQRKRYWFKTAAKKKDSVSMVSSQPSAHPMLGDWLETAQKQILFETRLSVETVPFLGDHVVHDLVILPTTAYLEMATAATRQVFGWDNMALEDLVINEALVFPLEGDRTVQMILSAMDQSDVSFQLFSRGDKGGESGWRLHATGKVAEDDAETVKSGEPVDLPDAIKARCKQQVDIKAFYQCLGQRGLPFGPTFQGIIRLYRNEGEAFGEVRVPEALSSDMRGYQIHPALLDACLQVVAAAYAGFDPAGHSSDIAMPIALDRFELHLPHAGPFLSYARLELSEGGNQEVRKAHVQILDESGQLVARVKGLRLKRIDQETLQEGMEDNLNDWLYQVTWKSKDLADAGSAVSAAHGLTRPRDIVKRSKALLSELIVQTGVEIYERLNPDLEALCAAYVSEALRRLGFDFKTERRFSQESLAQELGIVESHLRLFGRFLEILAEDGFLKRVGEAWEVRRIPDASDPQLTGKGLLEKYGDQNAEISLTQRCGAQLAEALRGEIDPLQLLFPAGDFESVERVYTATPVARVFNALAREALRLALESLPETSTIRILEVGAGTGGTTSHLLDMLPSHRTEYVFTDIGQAFVTKASRTFGHYSFLKYNVLDIEKDPEAQGFEGGQFDIVIASNVLHATRDLRLTLGHIRQLMAPKAMLLLLEGTKPQRWFDLTFGLTEGWWRFDDHKLRPSYPLVSRRQWLTLLKESGFTEAAALPKQEEGNALAKQAVFLATAPGIEEALPKVAGTDKKATWLLFADDENGAAEKLTKLFHEEGQETVLVSAGEAYKKVDDRHYEIDPKHPEGFHQLCGELIGEDRPPLRGVIHLWGLSKIPEESFTTDHLTAAQEKGCCSVLHLTQILLKADLSGSLGFWIVTRGAQTTGSEPAPLSIDQAPLWGLGKVISLEHPELNCVRVDLDPGGGTEDIQALFREIWTRGGENQIAYRGNQRYVARLVPYRPKSGPKKSPQGWSDQPVQLEITSPGVLDGLALRPVTRKKPGTGQVEIRVQATGLNFRDVLNALGMRDDKDPLGGECAGTIVSVGEGVRDFLPGDEVIAVTMGGFSTFATAHAQLVVSKPPRFSFEEAATLPLAFLTACYALHRVGKIGRGERVLIHAAAGGVGMAALQIAKGAGAEIFATAGNPEKREFLKSIGISHVMDSRSLTFAREVIDQTGGQGVDIVLNALTGESIPKSLSLLRPKGRFLEIGKAEIWDQKRVHEINRNADYFAVDLAEKLRSDPASIRPLFLELMASFEEGKLTPLPMRVFSLQDSARAFRYMAQAKHIGKVVVSQRDQIDKEGALIPEEKVGPITIRPDGAYLITGGLAGLGLLVAQWMVEKGAGALLLMARSKPSSAVLNMVVDMEKRGTKVILVQGDVSREEDLRKAIAQIREPLPPLRGVLHAAGVLDDGALLKQNWDRFSKVMAPKVQGAWNLHRVTENCPLDFFVLFSSAASLLGAPGEGNHAAANAFLDGLAHHRRARGLPALSINWGAWREIGAAERHKVAERIIEKGMGTFSPRQGLKILERLFEQNAVQVGVMPVQWERFIAQLGAGPEALFLSDLAKKPEQEKDVRQKRDERTDFLERLEGAPLNRQDEILRDCIRDQVIKILGLESSQDIDDSQPLNEAGLDSLMAVELRNLLGTGLRLKRSLPATLVFDYPTISALAGYVEREVLKWETSTDRKRKKEKEGDPDNLGLDGIEQLSDEEVDRLFSEKRMRGN